MSAGAPAANPEVQIVDVHKRYGVIEALKGSSLDIREG